MCSTEKKKDNSISGGLAIYQVLIYHIWYSKEQLSPFPGGSAGKESASIAGDQGLTPGWGRSPGEGNGNPLQYSCLENPIDRGPLATVHGVAKSWTRLSDFTFTFTFTLVQASVKVWVLLER